VDLLIQCSRNMGTDARALLSPPQLLLARRDSERRTAEVEVVEEGQARG
jgi:hypothetical protein